MKTPSRTVKFLRGDGEKIRAAVKERGTTISGAVREAMVTYGDGRARKRQETAVRDDHVNVFVDDVVYQRALERSRAEGVPIGDAVAEIILGADR